jgi:hypothetical protein
LRTTGHLFERRYKDKVVDADSYMLTLLRFRVSGIVVGGD